MAPSTGSAGRRIGFRVFFNGVVKKLKLFYGIEKQ